MIDTRGASRRRSVRLGESRLTRAFGPLVA